MTMSCDRIQELILDGLSGPMTPAGEREVAEHLAQCAACREFRVAVVKDDEQLTAYAETVSPSVSDLPERVAVALEKKTGEFPQPIPLWRKIMRSQISRISTAAAVLIAVSLMVVMSGRQTAWAQITEALQKAQRVHIVQVETAPDGKTEKDEWWFEKPNRFREEFPSSVTVDDGENRLVLDRQSRTAQSSDSQLEFTPIEQNQVFKTTVDLLGAASKEYGDVKLTPLADEQDGAIRVYAMQFAGKKEDVHAKGKLWVATDTMLPARLQMELTQRNARLGVPAATAEMTWSYDPIPKDVFSTAIPAGYKELPRMPDRALKGRVLSEQGTPVADAIVSATICPEGANGVDLDGKTDAQGNFKIKLPPLYTKWIRFPIFIMAYRQDDPKHVAWTVLTDPGDSKAETVRRKALISGDQGRRQISTAHAGIRECAGATGIVLTMEPAGRIYGTVTGLDGKPCSGAVIIGYAWLQIDLSSPMEPVEPICGYARLRWSRGIALPRGVDTAKKPLATTDAQGHYEVTNVPTSVFVFVQAASDGLQSKETSFSIDGTVISKEVNFRF